MSDKSSRRIKNLSDSLNTRSAIVAAALMLITGAVVAAFFFPRTQGLSDDVNELTQDVSDLQTELDSFNCSCNFNDFCSTATCANNSASINDLFNVTDTLQNQLNNVTCDCNTTGLCSEETCSSNTQSIGDLFNITNTLQNQLDNVTCDCNTTGLCSEETCSSNTQSIETNTQTINELQANISLLLNPPIGEFTVAVNITDGNFDPYVVDIAAVDTWTHIPYGSPTALSEIPVASGNFTIQDFGVYQVIYSVSLDVQQGFPRRLLIGACIDDMIVSTALVAFNSDSSSRYDEITLHSFLGLQPGNTVNFAVKNVENGVDVNVASITATLQWIKPFTPASSVKPKGPPDVTKDQTNSPDDPFGPVIFGPDVGDIPRKTRW